LYAILDNLFVMAAIQPTNDPETEKTKPEEGVQGKSVVKEKAVVMTVNDEIKIQKILQKANWFRWRHGTSVQRDIQSLTSVRIVGQEPYVTEAETIIKDFIMNKQKVTRVVKVPAAILEVLVDPDLSCLMETSWSCISVPKFPPNPHAKSDVNADIEVLIQSFSKIIVESTVKTLQEIGAEIEGKSTKKEELIVYIAETQVGWLLYNNGASIREIENKLQVQIIIEPWSVETKRRARIRGHKYNCTLSKQEIEKLLNIKCDSKWHQYKTSNLKSKQRVNPKAVKYFKQPEGLKSAYQFHLKKKRIMANGSDPYGPQIPQTSRVQRNHPYQQPNPNIGNRYYSYP